MFVKTTRNIKISVLPSYLPAQSEPREHHYVWAYAIHLENMGRETAQLMNRYWHITDALGQVQEVRGPGVVGEQPVLTPGSSYRYSSGVTLTTPSGLMTGTYEMTTPQGESFTIDIPAFSLDSPEQMKRAN